MKKYSQKISLKILAVSCIFVIAAASVTGCKKSEQTKDTANAISKQEQKDTNQTEDSKSTSSKETTETGSSEESTSLEETTPQETTSNIPQEPTAPETAAETTEPQTIPTFHVTDMLMTCYATQDVNVRKGPSTQYDRTGSLSANQEVTVTGQADSGWYRISYNGGEAYVSNSYLTSEPPTAPAPSVDESRPQEPTNPPAPSVQPSDSKAQKREQARAVAQEIANTIRANPEMQTDLDRVSAAAYVVSLYCAEAVYTTEGENYSEAYGVFISGEFSCAGATRALGMVLSCMGYEWEHANENQWTHQWCKVTMDGQEGWADGQIGFAGYGRHFVEG